MITIERLGHFNEVPDKLIQYVTMFPTSDLANEAIIGFILIGILKSESSVLTVCKTVEYLAKNESSKVFIEKLRNGNIHNLKYS